MAWPKNLKAETTGREHRLRCFLHLRNVKGNPWDHKRVDRICYELAPDLRIKPRKRLKRGNADALIVPNAPNIPWSIIAGQAVHSIAARGFHGGSPR